MGHPRLTEEYKTALWERYAEGESASAIARAVGSAHAGLKPAIVRVLAGAGWQRCKVHLMRNLLAHVPKAHKEMVAATVRTISPNPTPTPPARTWAPSPTPSTSRFPKVAELLLAAEADVTAYADFPRAHHRTFRDSLRCFTRFRCLIY